MAMQRLRSNLITGTKIGLLILALSLSLLAQGKNPVILIPGLSGSELRQKETNERVWFRTFKSKSEDLRLPITADPIKSRDRLVATDVLRTVKIGIFPITDVYGGFIKAMESRGGYHEESWDQPSEDGFEDSLYVYPYDWRLDNVTNARLLIRKIEALKAKLNKPALKFDIIAHSMGGLISRYAAMYGDMDLPAGTRKFVVTWAGAKHFDKVVLLGTPNEGATLALRDLTEGFSLGGLRIDLPFVQDMSKFTLFTLPSGYQLLPAPGTLKAFDDHFEPIKIDQFDPKAWTKYGWNTIDDPDFAGKFNAAERRAAPQFFAASLSRARKFHEALESAPGKTGGLSFYSIGSDCKTVLDAIIVYRDPKSNKYKTIFRPKGFVRTDGVKVSDEEVQNILMSGGDGVVTASSLRSERPMTEGYDSVLDFKSVKMICEVHNQLASNSKVQDHIIAWLADKTTSSDDDQEK